MARTNNSRRLLNSERIEQTFGSYGIEVLENRSDLRVSNLYSVHNGDHITRSFAVVKYVSAFDARFATEHKAIVGGGSIGKIFEGSGWQIKKPHSYMSEIEADDRFEPVYAMMGNIKPCSLALHVYLFVIKKDHRCIPYCVVGEVHHPDYLCLHDLEAIYHYKPGLPKVGDVQEMIDLVQQKMYGL